MTVNTKEIENFNKSLIEESFTSSFFNDALKKLSDIGNSTTDNPAQIGVDSDAYIDGSTKDIPSLDVEKISEPLKIVKDSFQEKALAKAASDQLAAADDRSMKNTFDAADMAQKSIMDDHPEKVQAIMQSNFLNKLDEDVRVGRLKPKDAIALNELNIRTIVRQKYSNVVANKNLSVDEKLSARELIIDGKTGDPSIDGLPLGLRIDALNDVEDQYSKLEKREKEMIEMDDWKTDRFLQDALVGLSQDELINGSATATNREMEIKRLISAARTPSQIKMVREWDSDWEPTQTVSLNMEEAERNGIANREYYESLYKDGYISAKTFRSKLSTLNEKLQESMKSDKFKEIDQRMKAIYGFQELGENVAYNIAKQTYMSNLAALDHIASQEEHENAYKAAVEVAKAFPGYQSDDRERENMVEFRRSTGYAVHEVDDIYNNMTSTLMKQRKIKRSDIGTEKGDMIIFSGMFNHIKENSDKTDAQINIILDKYKQIKKGE